MHAWYENKYEIVLPSRFVGTISIDSSIADSSTRLPSSHSQPVMAFNVYSVLAFFLCLLSIGQALSIPEVIDEVATIPSLLTRSLERRGKTCPAVWQTISSELKSTFQGCNRNARTAIRFAFHDAGGYSSKTPPYGAASGGADGSLLLNDDEMSRVSQQPMQDYRAYLRGIYDEYHAKITAADLIQFAGAVGLKSCPGGPTIKAVSSLVKLPLSMSCN